MNATSTSLLQQLQQDSGDEAWQRFLALYEPLLRRRIVQGGVCGADVDDVLQDVLTTLVQHMPKFQHNGRPGAFRLWLRILVRHRVLAFHRSQNRGSQRQQRSFRNELLDQLADANHDLSQQWDREHNRHVLQRILVQVEPQFTRLTWCAFCRQVLDGAPAKQVAEELGISQNSALIAKSRVLARLRAEAAGLLD